MTDDLIARLEAPKRHSVLRFSVSNVAGRKGYVWGGVSTDAEETARLLCDLYNNRLIIADALKASAL